MTSHQSYFQILGLSSPPEDRKAVKRAYSKMLKVTRPEDDPDGFMRLRDAHDTALNIIAHRAENAAWEAQQAAQEIAATPADHPTETAEPSLTYGDMLPPQTPQAEPISETSYAIGATPNFDAPVTQPEDEAQQTNTSYAIGPTPSLEAPVTYYEQEVPKAPPLIEELEDILSDPKHYNDRDHWNLLFRKARQLDIDDYVDFEQLLLDAILRFHGYYDHDRPHYDTPERLPQKLSPSITASLFKTMSWDQVNTQGYHRAHQIEWLERRMSARKRGAEPVPIPQTESGSSGNIWMWLFGAFILLKIVQALANG